MPLFLGNDKISKVVLSMGETTSGIDTSDATATVSDMVNGVTAYVNGEKITGNRRKLSYSVGTGSVVTNDDLDFVSISGNGAAGNKGGGRIYLNILRNFYGNAGDNVTVPFQAGTATTDKVLFGETFTSIGGNNLVGTYIPINTSDATATASDIISGKTAYVNGNKITGGYSIATDTVILTPTSDISSISFNVSGKPIVWFIIQVGNSRDWGNTRFICACNSNGNSTSMTTESSYGRQYTYSKYITSEYTDCVLTITTSNSSYTGTFRGGIPYQLQYIYENVTIAEPEPELPDGEVGYISSNNEIFLSDNKVSSGTYKLYYEDENNSKLNGWDSIGTIINY